MDYGKTYIKMWLASGLEIEPDMFQPWVCPYCYDVTHSYIRAICANPRGCPRPRTKIVPLPRQDQLQGMLPQKGWRLIRTPYKNEILFTFEVGYFGTFKGDTPEQAIIQGVMHELHGKIWDGEKWVKK